MAAALPHPAATKDLGDNIAQLSAKIPDNMVVSHQHNFSDRSRGVIIGIFLLLLAFAATLAVTINLWRRNSELKESNIKYRMLRQYYPMAAAWAERTYTANPDSALCDVEQKESLEERLRLAEKAAAKREK